MVAFFAPLLRSGWPCVALFSGVTLILYLFSSVFGLIGLLLTIWCAYFFRNPQRITPLGDGLVISPADGIITRIEESIPPNELKWKKEVHTRISIFLNIFDVHVNRIPVDGIIKKIHYHPGKFFNAALDKASDHNERNFILIETPQHKEILVIQIAGFIARRILCDVHKGDTVRSGQVFGMIRFGSRVDIYLPRGVHPQVVKGQRMIGGETILADLTSKASQRIGENRA